MKLAAKKKADFQKVIWDYYTAHARVSLPWRKSITPYRIWISEVMLQQTQADRVVTFFNNWMKLFPTITSLAQASQVDLLRAWKGLGYNSRALRLKKAAQQIMDEHRGVFPKVYEDILNLPGIGPYTAGAISAFAYNRPITMIETNIRRVYLHHFFKNEHNVHDAELLKVIEQTVPAERAREWYWALMDYGAYLAKVIPNPNKRSRHYTVQKQFKGSDRQIRGRILEILLQKRSWELESLVIQLAELSTDTERIETILSLLEQEEFLTINKGRVFLKK
jgi:A/G-specific adenine glycosylase